MMLVTWCLPLNQLTGHFCFFSTVSTTVVNPSIWMPMYESSSTNAIFFVLFIIVSVFYLHSLVLSVVFSTYIQAAAEIHERSVTAREDAIRMSFLALVRDDQTDSINTAGVRKTLQLVRPHYSGMKVCGRHTEYSDENRLQTI